MNSLSNLPNDVSGVIFSFLNTKYTLSTLKVVNKYVNRVILHSPTTWLASRIEFSKNMTNCVNLLPSLKFVKHLEFPVNRELNTLLVNLVVINTAVEAITFLNRFDFMLQLTPLRKLRNLTHLKFFYTSINKFEGLEELSQLKCITLEDYSFLADDINDIIFQKPGLINLETLECCRSFLPKLALFNLPSFLHLIIRGGVYNYGHYLQSITRLSLIDDFDCFLLHLPKLLYFECSGEQLTLERVTRNYATNNKQLKSIGITCNAIGCSQAEDVLLLLKNLPELENFTLKIYNENQEFPAVNHCVWNIYNQYKQHKSFMEFKLCLLLLKEKQAKEVEEMIEYLSYCVLPTFEKCHLIN